MYYLSDGQWILSSVRMELNSFLGGRSMNLKINGIDAFSKRFCWKGGRI